MQKVHKLTVYSLLEVVYYNYIPLAYILLIIKKIIKLIFLNQNNIIFFHYFY